MLREINRRDFLIYGTATVAAGWAALNGFVKLTEASESLVPVEVTAWDGLDIFPVGMNITSFESAIEGVKGKYENGGFKEGYVRSYDRESQIAKDPKSLLLKNYEEALSTYNQPSKNLDYAAGRLVWNGADENGNFPKAKDIRSHLQEQAKSILKGLGFSEISPWQVMALTNNIINNTFIENDGTITTRNTYAANSDTRLDQPERTICSIYDKKTRIGHEYIDPNSGILHLSNEANLKFTFDVSLDGIKPAGMEFSGVSVKTPEGDSLKLSWIVEDLGSQPDNNIFGIPTPTPSGKVWMSQLLRPCGPIAPNISSKSNAPSAPTNEISPTQVVPGKAPTPGNQVAPNGETDPNAKGIGQIGGDDGGTR